MTERPAKRTKLLSDDEDSDSPTEADNGLSNGSALKINQEFARRFEHNSRRAELHRLEEKLGPNSTGKVDQGDGSETESSSEEEDENGDLAPGEIEEQFQAVLTAIRNKDPKIYDPKVTFFAGIEDSDGVQAPIKSKAAKPMYLNDYHREKLLRGDVGAEEGEDIVQPTYVQQQEELKRAVTREMHEAAESGTEDDEEAEDEFLVAKALPEGENGIVLSLSKEEVERADDNPEAFLHKFIETRAWVQPSKSEPHPFESDDDEEEERAEDIEQAYNMRFEDPDKANEKLKSHARDAAAKFSTRKEKTTKRQRAREVAREAKDAEKQERTQDRARLRKLRMEEAQEKLERIQDAAGLGVSQIDVSKWQDFLTDDWDDKQWEQEMQQRFGDKYYEATSDHGSDDEDEDRKKPRKPKWKDDIDIRDLMPDYDSDQEKHFSLSDEEENLDEADNGREAPQEQKSKKRKDGKKQKQQEARKQKRLVEQLVEEKLGLEEAMDGVQRSKAGAGFRYRETSPVAFGMTARDILMASDSQLNQYAGLKKMAAFRDTEKKRKDRKRLGKKARLRQWRRDTFGDEQGPQGTLQELVQEQLQGAAGPGKKRGGDAAVDVREGKRRKKAKNERSVAA